MKKVLLGVTFLLYATSAQSASLNCGGRLGDFPEAANNFARAKIATQFTRTFQNARAKCRSALALIKDRPLAERTFKNTIEAYYEAVEEYLTQVDVFTMLHSRHLVQLNSAARALSGKMAEDDAEYRSEVMSDEDLFHALMTIVPKNSVEAGILARLKKTYEDSGVGLPVHIRGQVTEIAQREMGLVNEFMSRLSKASSVIRLSAAELKGVSAQIMDSLKVAQDGLYSIETSDLTLKRAILGQADLEATRKKVWLTRHGRASENEQVIRDVADGRFDSTRLVHQRSYLEHVIDQNTLPGSEASLRSVLDDLLFQLKKPMRAHIDKLQAQKISLDGKGAVAPWDIMYLERKLSESRHNQDALNSASPSVVDTTRLFPAQYMVDRVLKSIGQRFGLEFIERKDAPKHHPSVKVYEVRALEEPRSTLSFIYIDAFNRPGENGVESFVSPIQAPRWVDGKIQPGIAFVRVSWGQWKDRKTLFLGSDQLRSMYHEMGHVLHAIFSVEERPGQYAMKSGMDFIELPSTVLERMVQVPEVLVEISGSDLSQSLALTLPQAREIAKAERRFRLTDGAFYHPIYSLDRLMLTIFDLKLADEANRAVAPRVLYQQAFEEFYGIPADPEDGFPGTFHHGAAGYLGEFWTYIWAGLAAGNVNARLEDLGGFNSPAATKAFIENILQPTLEVPASVRLERMLGRPMSSEPILKEMGISRESLVE